jgi:probable HAF family extracellular repeat protein
MRFIRLSITAAAMLALAVGLGNPAAAAPSAGVSDSGGVAGHLSRTYHSIDLGTLGGAESTARAINNRDQVVGDSETTDHEIRPFLWQHGKMIDLGNLGGYQARAHAINNRGQVVGSSDTDAASGYAHHAFVWRDGVMTDLGTLGGNISAAYGINDSGQVAGVSLTETDGWHAFVWRDGVMTDLGPFDARAINNRGQIAGTAGDHAVVWQRGTLTDLGAPTTGAAGINDAGAIIGSADNEHAFVRWHGSIIDLGTLGGAYSVASDINDRGQIVGVSSLAGIPPVLEHPFLWQRGAMTDLTTSGLDQTAFVVAINDRGQIAGASGGHAALFSRR